MKGYRPYEGLRVCLLARGAADRHDRRVHNVPDDCGMSWKPYTVRVTSYGAVAYKAFHSVRELKTWMGADYKLIIAGPWQHAGIRSGTIHARGRRS